MSVGQHIEWRLTQAAYDRFRELLDELQATNMNSPRYHTLLDDMRSLPGFPHQADPERDLIHFNVTSARTH